MQKTKMRIAFKAYDKLMPLSKLKESEYQHNKHPKEQVERLAKLMREKGVRQPIYVSKRSGNICFGHGRKKAALLNGWTDYPIVYQEFKSDREEFLCVQSDNAIAGWSDLDIGGIKDDLESMDDIGDLDTDLLGIENFVLEDNEGESEPTGVSQKTIFEVVITCKNEKEQEKIYEQLTEQGLSCRVLSM